MQEESRENEGVGKMEQMEMGDLDSQVSAHLCTLVFAHVMHYDQTLRTFSL